MKLTKLALGLAATASISGCQVFINQDNTSSGFATPTPSGQINQNLANRRSGNIIAPDGDGIAYVVGSDFVDGFVGLAGVIPGTDLGALPSAGTVTFSGTFELAEVTGIVENGNFLTGTTGVQAGNLTLNADFQSGTVQGFGVSTVSDRLDVNGVIQGSGNVVGSVTFAGVNGELTGLAGQDGFVGAFHGNNDRRVFAGGFVAKDVVP